MIWLLAVVLPLQGMAATLVQLCGPTHVHAAPIGATVILVDPRRDVVGSTTPHASQAALIEDLHARSEWHAAPHRHHHAFADASVTYVDGERFIDGNGADGGSTGDASLAFLPMAPSASPWIAVPLAHAQAAAPAWAPTGAPPSRLDRPPQPSLR